MADSGVIGQVIDIFLHLDAHLNALAVSYGPWLYGILFAIVFCETGLVVTPFLPGDSLLFAVGALAATEGSPLNIFVLVGLLLAAAFCGDMVNYHIGKHAGPKVFSRQDSWLLNKKYLIKAQAFYEKHGGKTIILARFIPIVRTFAPFVAGIGRMNFGRYVAYCVTGAVAWVGSFLVGGFLLGNAPIVKQNFHYVVVAIIVISVLPGVVEFLKAKRVGRTTAQAR